MTDPFGLKPEVVSAIRAVLAQFDCIEQAILYGSRAKGDYKHGSDIDLTLTVKEEPPKSLLLHIDNALDDLDLPYSFDLSLLQQISNKNLLEHIKRVGVVFFSQA
jgi:type I restriction enzyme R subunit